MGISPTILMISLVMVSTMGSGLLITNIDEIKETAEDVLSDVISEITGGFLVVSAHAHAVEDPFMVESIHLKLKPGHGSDPIGLDDLVIELSTTSHLLDITINSTEGSYSYNGIMDHDGSIESGIANEGDLFKLIIRLGPVSESIRSGSMLDLLISTGNGGSTNFGIVFPDPLYSTWTRLK